MQLSFSAKAVVAALGSHGSQRCHSHSMVKQNVELNRRLVHDSAVLCGARHQTCCVNAVPFEAKCVVATVTRVLRRRREKSADFGWPSRCIDGSISPL
jgi:hypothetical protein